MPLLALLVIFIIVPLAELYVIYKVGGAIGVVPTLLLLAADSVLGSLLLKSQGRAVWRRFNEAIRAGRVPHNEVIDGVLVIFGGAFLITPGFLTDVIGLILLLPPTRHIVPPPRRPTGRSGAARIATAFRPRPACSRNGRRMARRSIEQRAVGSVGGAPAPGRGRRTEPNGFDVEGTAHEVDSETRRLPR